MVDPENIPELTHEEAIADLVVDMPEVKEATPDVINEPESSPGTEPAPAAETTIDELTVTPPHPDHLAFLRGLPDGEFGFNLMVYADRVEEDGLHEAAHVLRHHDGYFTYRKNVLALHRAICAQIERIFGCRYAPSSSLFDSPEIQKPFANPSRLYIRKSSLRCFSDWPPQPEGRYANYELSRLLDQFEKTITGLDPTGTRQLILRGRPLQYEVATLPILLAYLSGLPSQRVTVRPAS